MTVSIFELFRTLNEWRHLPAYQLERRVDVFFGMFLAEVIEKTFCVSGANVIPEFPLHKGSISNNSGNNRTANVDFAVFAEKENEKHIFLVELKTDIESLNEKQLTTMRNAKAIAKSSGLLNGVKKAAIASNSKHKYAQLIWKLLKLDCLHLDAESDLTEKCMNKGKRGLKSVFKELSVGEKWVDASVHLVVILPEKPKPKFEELLKGICRIYFCDFSKKMSEVEERIDSDFESEFIKFMDIWSRERAGFIDPWK